MKPVEIVGGGLAGLALASALRKHGVEVEVHEAGTYPRHRVCGEFIAGVRPQTLESLGIKHVFNDAFELASVAWFLGDKEVRKVNLPRPAIGISRWKLDQRLADHLTRNGTRLLVHSRSSDAGTEGRVIANGRRPKKPGEWIGLKVHARGFPLTADLEMHVGSRGYAGASPVGEGITNVCGLFRLQRQCRAEPKRLLEHYLEASGLHSLALRLNKAEILPESLSAVSALDYSRPCPPKADEMRLGDARGLIAPLTGNGMSIAFESAEMALGPLIKWANSEIHWHTACRQINTKQLRRLRVRWSTGATLQRLLLNPHLQRPLAAFARTPAFPFRTLFTLTHG